MNMHITEKAENTKINNCEFVGVGIVNEGKNTSILRSKFQHITSTAKDWSSKWWGKIIIGLIIFLITSLITYLINK